MLTMMHMTGLGVMVLFIAANIALYRGLELREPEQNKKFMSAYRWSMLSIFLFTSLGVQSVRFFLKQDIERARTACERLDPTTDAYIESIYELRGLYNELQHSLNEVYETAQDGSASFAMVAIQKERDKIVRQIKQKAAVVAPEDIPKLIQSFLDEHRSE